MQSHIVGISRGILDVAVPGGLSKNLPDDLDQLLFLLLYLQVSCKKKKKTKGHLIISPRGASPPKMNVQRAFQITDSGFLMPLSSQS